MKYYIKNNFFGTSNFLFQADKKPNEDEDIDSIIKEVNEFASNSSTKVSQDKGTIFKSCFTVEMRLIIVNKIVKLFCHICHNSTFKITKY